MELLQGCRVFAIMSIVLLSGCISGRTADLYNSYSDANMKDEVSGLLKNTKFFMDNKCRSVLCEDPFLVSQGVYEMRCTMKTGPTSTSKKYTVDVMIVNDKINEIKYNGTTIT